MLKKPFIKKILIKFLDTGQSRKADLFNGSFVLQLGSYYDHSHKDGFKNNKCLHLASPGIKEVRGTFINDSLQV